MYGPADVSVCIPAWCSRPVDVLALTATVAAYEALGCEVSVCDDGSAVKLHVERLCRLPLKFKALNPCVPINHAVRNSTHPTLLLTNPGMAPPAGLYRMLAELVDPNAYVAAACRDRQTGRWLVHSSVKGGEHGRGPMPDGSGFHHCAVLSRELYERAGGFDEDYREGQGYDDNDFLWRLHAVGARFKVLDDVVLEHDRSETVWPAGGLERNRALFESKWPNCK